MKPTPAQAKLLKSLPTWEGKLHPRTLRSAYLRGWIKRDMAQQSLILLTDEGTRVKGTLT